MCVAGEYTKPLSEIITCLYFYKTLKNNAALIMVSLTLDF